MDTQEFHDLLEECIEDIYDLPNVKAPANSTLVLCKYCGNGD